MPRGYLYIQGEGVPAFRDLPRLSYRTLEPQGPERVVRKIQLTSRLPFVDSTCFAVLDRWIEFLAGGPARARYAAVLDDPASKAGYVVQLGDVRDDQEDSNAAD